MENQQVVGIAQFAVSDKPTDVLVAPNLGSCLGIAIYDFKNKFGGMVHCLLPLSKSDPEKASKSPCMYVDTGFALLMEKLIGKGSNKKDLQIVAVGGANINDDNNVFEIGKKNHTVLKKILWKNGLLLRSEHIGDTYSRTLSLYIEDGKVVLRAQGQALEL